MVNVLNKSTLRSKVCYSHLVSVCGRNVVVLCSQVRCCYNEVHVEVCIIILLETDDDNNQEWHNNGMPTTQEWGQKRL